ncbi:phosphatidate cytidylyltransferase [Erythrobacter mangrovi]|uniref:phosphatidate cytidylyltransferase n=1 Tax=Erythrobacter mangrovi TaxID=2739433 RepID=UPI001F3EFB84|nr:phosphatidate cytidylyltransferase [Erythrobacter mangrovi]
MGDAETIAAAAPRKNADLPVRVASAAVMLAVAIGALIAGDPWLDLFIGAVVLVGFGELVRLVWKATPNLALRLGGIAFGVAYMGIAGLVMSRLPVPLVIGLVGTVICIDTFAYFTGRALGGPKIAPSISPSKTWAGLLGAIIGATLWLVIWVAAVRYPMTGSMLPQFDMIDMSQILFIGPLAAVCAQAGDFFESWLKRKAGEKDSSQLIPGHGGVFDRIDGMIPAALLAGALLGGAG